MSAARTYRSLQPLKAREVNLDAATGDSDVIKQPIAAEAARVGLNLERTEHLDWLQKQLELVGLGALEWVAVGQAALEPSPLARFAAIAMQPDLHSCVRARALLRSRPHLHSQHSHSCKASRSLTRLAPTLTV